MMPATRSELDELLKAMAAAGMYAWTWDLATGRVTWAEGIEDLFGLAKGDFTGTFDGYVACIAEDERPRVLLAIDRALSGQTPSFFVEHRVQTDGAVERWICGRGNVVRDEQGRPLRMAGLTWDVTAAKVADARLARLHRLWSVVRAINKQLLHVRSEGELFEGACRIAVELGEFRFAWVALVGESGEYLEPVARWGYEAGYLTGLRIPTDPRPEGRGPAGTAFREGASSVIDDTAQDPRFLPWRAAALARNYRSCAAFPLRRGGRPVGVLVVYAERPRYFDEEQMSLLGGLVDDMSYALDLLDRDERRRGAEAAVRLSEERYRSVFDQAFEAIFLVSPDYRITEANESACRMLGYGHEELLQMRAADVVDPVDLAAVPLRFGITPKGGVLLSKRTFLRKDRSRLAGEVSTKALPDGTFQVVVRDVTARRQVQAQLLLTDRMTSIGRLASGVAHEVNNPLAYVTLNLELIARRLQSPASLQTAEGLDFIAHAIADARDGAERVRRIVRMLTTFGRGDEEALAPVDVNEVMDSAAEIAALQIRHLGRLVKRYGATRRARANAFRLGQVFVNLLVNAADAFKEPSIENAIEVTTSDGEGPWVVVEVKDNGLGIPLDVQARMFDPFFTTKPFGRGTGLGLSVCHSIVVGLGGAIACESAPGAGATFRVTLPSEGPSTPLPAAVPGARPPSVRGRVLVVDDDARVAAAVATALEDHDVTVAHGGREAIERCRAEQFDCVLCDLMMPEVTGVDVVEALRRDGEGRDQRVVFMTGGAVKGLSREHLSRFSNPVLEKPVDGDALRDVVARFVQRSRS